MTENDDAPFNILIIMDDCISSINEAWKYEKEKRLVEELFNNRRHLVKGATISIILTS
jgi:hypothetical protein